MTRVSVFGAVLFMLTTQSCANDVNQVTDYLKLDASVRNIARNGNRVVAFMVRPSDHSRDILKEKISAAARPEELLQNRVAGPEPAAKLILRAWVSVDTPITVFYRDGILLVESPSSRPVDKTPTEEVFLLVYLPTSALAGRHPLFAIERVVSVITRIEATY